MVAGDGIHPLLALPRPFCPCKGSCGVTWTTGQGRRRPLPRARLRYGCQEVLAGNLFGGQLSQKPEPARDEFARPLDDDPHDPCGNGTPMWRGRSTRRPKRGGRAGGCPIPRRIPDHPDARAPPVAAASVSRRICECRIRRPSRLSGNRFAKNRTTLLRPTSLRPVRVPESPPIRSRWRPFGRLPPAMDRGEPADLWFGHGSRSSPSRGLTPTAGPPGRR